MKVYVLKSWQERWWRCREGFKIGKEREFRELRYRDDNGELMINVNMINVKSEDEDFEKEWSMWKENFKEKVKHKTEHKLKDNGDLDHKVILGKSRM